MGSASRCLSQPVHRTHFITVVRYSLKMNNCGMPTHCPLKSCSHCFTHFPFLFLLNKEYFSAVRLCAAEVFPKAFSTHLVLSGENAEGTRWVELTEACGLSFPDFWVCPVSIMDDFHLVMEVLALGLQANECLLKSTTRGPPVGKLHTHRRQNG